MSYGCSSTATIFPRTRSYGCSSTAPTSPRTQVIWVFKHCTYIPQDSSHMGVQALHLYPPGFKSYGCSSTGPTFTRTQSLCQMCVPELLIHFPEHSHMGVPALPLHSPGLSHTYVQALLIYCPGNTHERSRTAPICS
ncbi:hypothetical protein DPMN_106548 [Dreissena polymorpha]|uniref:Uncharacterized protein n=1 Tax=Dreissena polymorpha TaxID=45954 RepID=A0A9D4K560_DREPO|nr:hypothetical protein DPMN_106548 [Dreissena polymorpha]